MLAQYTQAHSLLVNSLVFSPHRPASASPLLCSTSSDATAAFWDTRLPPAEACVLRLAGHHHDPINHALFMPEDEYALLTAADDASIVCWDIRRPDLLVARLQDFREGVNKMILLPSDSLGSEGGQTSGSSRRHVIASACDDGLVYIHALDLHSAPSHDANSQQQQEQQQVACNSCHAQLLDKFWVSTSTVNDLLVLPHAPQILLTASEDCAVRSWRLTYHHRNNNNSSNNNNNNSSNSNDDRASLHRRNEEGEEERLLASLDEFENPVNHIALVPPGLLPGESEFARAPAAATPSHNNNTNNNRVSDDAHNSTGSRLGAEGPDEEDDSQAAGEAGAAMPSHTNNTQHGGNHNEEEEDEACGKAWLLAACSEFVFGVDMNERRGSFGRGARSFVGHRDYVRGLDFTAAGTLLTVSDDGTAMEWDVVSGEPIRQVRLHDTYVMASAISPQKEMFASGGNDGVIRLWRLPFETERMTGARA